MQFPYLHSHCLANLLSVATEHALVFSKIQCMFSGRKMVLNFCQISDSSICCAITHSFTGGTIM